jgi:hypothetical protein
MPLANVASNELQRMRTFARSRCALSVSVAATFLAACGGSQPPIDAQRELSH